MGNSWERSFNETQVLPVLFPIKTKEAYRNEQMVPLVKGVTSFFTRKDRGNLLILCNLQTKKKSEIIYVFYPL